MAAMSTLTDDFTTKDTTKWTWTGTADVSGGRLQLPANNDTISASSFYTLAGSAASLQVVQYPTTGGDVEVNFRVEAQTTGDLFHIQWYGGDQKIYCGERVSGTYSWDGGTSTTDKWMRIREAGGTVFWDTSADGASWTARRSKTWAVSGIANMFPNIYYMGSAGGTTLIDNFNIPGTPAPPPVAAGQFFAMF